MAKKTWIEVALNGAMGRKTQPGIPVTAEEIVSDGVGCIQAGAAILHAHPLDPNSTRQNDDLQLCVQFASEIKNKVDAIIYPGLILNSRNVEELTRHGLLEWAAIDPGSTNFLPLDKGPEPMFNDGVYANPIPNTVKALSLAAKHQLHPSYACFEPGFIRIGAELHRMNPQTPVPIYRYMFSSGFAFGFPPEIWALEAYVKLTEQVAPGAPWMVAGLAVDVLPLVPAVVAMGGHLRVGLEDAPYNRPDSNIKLVEKAVDAVQRAGGEPATASEVRISLARAG
jgi:3-keto-5-aminohexanoate cleavage enzyme